MAGLAGLSGCNRHHSSHLVQPCWYLLLVEGAHRFNIKSGNDEALSLRCGSWIAAMCVWIPPVRSIIKRIPKYGDLGDLLGNWKKELVKLAFRSCYWCVRRLTRKTKKENVIYNNKCAIAYDPEETMYQVSNLHAAEYSMRACQVTGIWAQKASSK